MNKIDCFNAQLTEYISYLVRNWCSLGILILSILGNGQFYKQLPFANINTLSFPWHDKHKYIQCPCWSIKVHNGSVHVQTVS